jgi:predicted RNA binding protein YcfA (HicA-like mRNA interferase family)
MADLPVRRVLRALERAGFVLVRRRGSHRVYRNAQGRQLTFAYHDGVRLGTPALSGGSRKNADLELEQLLQLA